MRLEQDIIGKQNTFKNTHQSKIVSKVAVGLQNECKKNNRILINIY